MIAKICVLALSHTLLPSEQSMNCNFTKLSITENIRLKFLKSVLHSVSSTDYMSLSILNRIKHDMIKYIQNIELSYILYCNTINFYTLNSSQRLFYNLSNYLQNNLLTSVIPPVSRSLEISPVLCEPFGRKRKTEQSFFDDHRM